MLYMPPLSTRPRNPSCYLLTEPRKEKENLAVAASPAKEAYLKLLAEKLLNNLTRILDFRNKPPKPETSAERILDAPELVDDHRLNLLDCGSNNVLSIGLGSTVYLWDASSGSTSELVTIDEGYGPVTSIY
ncbi:hypothetical protein U9M48_026114 [Paspalum notatum var. saurae]|uniref:Uncharacterized protein n=1 Tax=Paspalum notatum var. saurae TaxID=547442 RepID=A0AAQ3WYG4_PASNO